MRHRTWKSRAVGLVAAAVAATVVSAGGFDAGPAAATPTPTTGQHNALILRAAWPGTSAAASDGLDRAVTDDINPWMRSLSANIFSGWSVTDPGRLQIVKPPLGPDNACDANFLTGIRTGAEQAAEEHGINMSGWSVIIYWFPLMPCDFSGRGEVLGTRVYLNGVANAYVLKHELGHHLGLGHAHSLLCRDANGARVPLSTNCTTIEYGDTNNVMGSGFGAFNAIQLDRLGWINGTVRTVSVPGDSFVTPLTDPAAGTGIRALRIPGDQDTMWVEFRRSVGVDTGVFLEPGNVFIYLERPDPLTTSGSYLLEMKPDTFPAAGLSAGESWINPLSHTRITVNSVTASAAHITVASTLVSVPNVLSYSRASAKATISGAGLTVGTVSQANDCADPGNVENQSPAGGSTVVPGTAVDITISICTGGGTPK